MLLGLWCGTARAQPAEEATTDPSEESSVEAVESPPPAQEAVVRYTSATAVDLGTTLTPREVNEAPGSVGDPIRAVQNLPGLVRTPLDAGWLLVRGGYPDDTGAWLDGVRVPQIFHLGGLTSIVHPAMVDRLRFYPGGAPQRLGRSLSGAAEIATRRLEGDWRAEAGLNLVWAHAFFEAPIGHDAGVAVSVRRSYLDGILRLALDADRAQIAPRFWDASVRVDSPQAGLTIVGLSDAADVPADNGDTSDVTQRGIQIQGRLQDASGRLSAFPWFRYNDREIQAPGRVERLRDRVPGLRLQADLDPSALVRLQTGVEAELHAYQVFRDADRFDKLFGNIDPYGDLTVGDNVEGTLGLRVDTLMVRGQRPRAGLSPRLATRIEAGPDWVLLAEVYQTHQTPNPVYLVGPEGPYLPLERNRAATIGMRWTHAPFGVGIDAWARRTDHLASLEQDGSLGQLQGRALGVDTTWRLQWPNTVITLIYQLSSARLREEPEDAFAPTVYDQPHRVNLVAVQRLPRAWTLSGRWRYATGFLVPDGATAYDILRGTQLAIARDARGRAAPYHALDLKVAKRFEWTHGHLDIYLDVQNVYDRRVAEPAINGVDDAIVSYGVGLPILPIFGIEGGWGRPGRSALAPPP